MTTAELLDKFDAQEFEEHILKHLHSLLDYLKRDRQENIFAFIVWLEPGNSNFFSYAPTETDYKNRYQSYLDSNRKLDNIEPAAPSGFKYNCGNYDEIDHKALNQTFYNTAMSALYSFDELRWSDLPENIDSKIHDELSDSLFEITIRSLNRVAHRFEELDTTHDFIYFVDTDFDGHIAERYFKAGVERTVPEDKRHLLLKGSPEI